MSVKSEKIIIELRLKIKELSDKIQVLNNKASNEKVKTDKDVINYDKNNLIINTKSTVDYLEEIRKLKAELDILIRKLNEELNKPNPKPEESDEGLGVHGPAAFSGVDDPKNKFHEGDYVVVIGSSKPEKQKFIRATGKIVNVLEHGVGKNTSNMTRYDVNFGDLGSANFKESRLRMGNANDYKSTSIIGGESYYDKYIKYRNKYLLLKEIKGGDINDLQLKNKDNHIAELNKQINELKRKEIQSEKSILEQLHYVDQKIAELNKTIKDLRENEKHLKSNLEIYKEDYKMELKRNIKIEKEINELKEKLKTVKKF